LVISIVNDHRKKIGGNALVEVVIKKYLKNLTKGLNNLKIGEL
jgi:hypothetical protein